MRSSVCTMKILLLIVLLSPVLAVNALKPGYTPDEWTKSNGRLHGLRKPNDCFVWNCKKCSPSRRSTWTSCDKCDHGFVRVPLVSGRYACWNNCPFWLKEINGTCVKERKPADCTPNCQKCENMRCSVCEDGYSLYRGLYALKARCMRQCPYGHIKEVNPMGGHKCVRQCTPNCKKCKDGFSCSFCEHGYALYKGFLGFKARCVRRCPRGYRTELNPMGDKKCVKPCQVVDCAFCPKQTFRLNRCFRCNPGLYKLSTWTSDFCFSLCPSGYVPKTVNGVNFCKRYEPAATAEPTVGTTLEQTTERESTTAKEPITTRSGATHPFTEPESWTTLETTTNTTESESSNIPEPTTTPEPTNRPEPTTNDAEFWP